MVKTRLYFAAFYLADPILRSRLMEKSRQQVTNQSNISYRAPQRGRVGDQSKLYPLAAYRLFFSPPDAVTVTKICVSLQEKVTGKRTFF